jgi:hypothetical protein
VVWQLLDAQQRFDRDARSFIKIEPAFGEGCATGLAAEI